VPLIVPEFPPDCPKRLRPKAKKKVSTEAAASDFW